MNNNNTFTEISMLILAILLIVAGSLLLYVGKIGYDAAIFFFISALGLFGFNGALKAPSAQQSQLAAQQQQSITAVQELALNVANTQQSLMSQAHTHAEPVQAPADTTTVVQPPPVQPQYQFVPVNRHFGDTGLVPIPPQQ